MAKTGKNCISRLKTIPLSAASYNRDTEKYDEKTLVKIKAMCYNYTGNYFAAFQFSEV